MTESTQLPTETATVNERAKDAASAAGRWLSAASSAIALEVRCLAQLWHIRGHRRDLQQLHLECGRSAAAVKLDSTDPSIATAARRAAELASDVQGIEVEVQQVRSDLGTIDRRREPSGARTLRSDLRRLNRRCRDGRRELTTAQTHLGQLILANADADRDFVQFRERAGAAKARLAAAETKLGTARTRQRTFNRSLGVDVRWLMLAGTAVVCVLVVVLSRAAWPGRTAGEPAANAAPLGTGTGGPSPGSGGSDVASTSGPATAPVAAGMKRWPLGPGMTVDLPSDWEVIRTGVGDRWVEIRSGDNRLTFTVGTATLRPEPQAGIPKAVETFWDDHQKDKREVTTPVAVYERREYRNGTALVRGRLKVRDVTRVRVSRVWFWGQGDEAVLAGYVARINAGLRSDGVLADRESTDEDLFRRQAGKGFSLQLPKEGLTTCKADGDAVLVYYDDPEGAGYACLAFAVLGNRQDPVRDAPHLKVARTTLEYFRENPARVHGDWLTRPQARYRLAWPPGAASGKEDPATVYGQVTSRPEDVDSQERLWFWGHGDQVALGRLLMNVRQGYRLEP